MSHVFIKFWPDLNPVMGLLWKCRTFNSGHFLQSKNSDGPEFLQLFVQALVSN